MPFDSGFDIYPRLEPTAANKETYRRFLDEIIRTYENVYNTESRTEDGKVLALPTDLDSFDKIYLHIMVGSCPQIPFSIDHCEYFLRFSSEVSGYCTAPVERYLTGVCDIARKHFDGWVQSWHDIADDTDRTCYTWWQVRDAERQLRELNRNPVVKKQDASEEKVGITEEQKTRGATS